MLSFGGGEGNKHFQAVAQPEGAGAESTAGTTMCCVSALPTHHWSPFWAAKATGKHSLNQSESACTFPQLHLNSSYGEREGLFAWCIAAPTVLTALSPSGCASASRIPVASFPDGNWRFPLRNSSCQPDGGGSDQNLLSPLFFQYPKLQIWQVPTMIRHHICSSSVTNHKMPMKTLNWLLK